MHRTRYHNKYAPEDCVVFCKTRERWGGLSNMAAGFPLRVNGENIRTSEALYQACRFPSRPDVQRMIVNERSPKAAKMRVDPYRQDYCRPDWGNVREKVMRWCLRVKLAQNFEKFRQLLQSTGTSQIVELSHMDVFWGARPEHDGLLHGENMLGLLLMELRNALECSSEESLTRVEPPEIENLLLFGRSVETVHLVPDNLPLFE